MNSGRTSFKELFDLIPSKVHGFEAPESLLKGSRVAQLLNLRSWGDNPDSLTIENLGTGHWVASWMRVDVEQSAEQKPLTSDDVWRLLPVIDSHWHLVRAKLSLSFGESLSGEEKIPSWVYQKIRNLQSS